MLVPPAAAPVADDGAAPLIQREGTEADGGSPPRDELERMTRSTALCWELRGVTRQHDMERTPVQPHEEAAAGGEEELGTTDYLDRLMMDGISENAVVLLDAEGRVTAWHAGAEQIKGYTEQEVLGQHVTLFYVPEDVQPGEPAQLFRQAAAEGSARSEGWLVRKDGERFFAEVSLTALRDAAGVLTGFAMVTRDRTEWKLAYDMVRDVEAQLRHVHKMDAIGRVAGTMVHDFNNVLTVVKVQAELAMEDVEPGQGVWSDLREIVKAAERGVALNHQLLAFSRVSPLEPTLVEPHLVIADLKRMMGRVLGEQVRLEMQLDPVAGAVRIDRTQLEQILMNLAANARDAMERGGTFTIRTRRVELRPELAHRQPGVQPGSYLLLTTSDTGCGMDAETQARCFEPFFTTRPKGKGTGLGLATVYGVLRQNAGHIGLESQPGRGTTFRIYLPVAEGGAGAVETPEAAPPLPRERTVLLVEDEDRVRHVIRRTLERDGYAVLETSTAKTALRLAADHASSIDAVVWDRVVPGSEPEEFLEALEDLLPGVAVVQISTYAMSEWTGKNDVGRSGLLLSKPFAPNELISALHTLLGGTPGDTTPADS